MVKCVIKSPLFRTLVHTCSFCLANEALKASKKQKKTALLMPLDSALAPTPLHTPKMFSTVLLAFLTARSHLCCN